MFIRKRYAIANDAKLNGTIKCFANAQMILANLPFSIRISEAT
jgi:hypothetical protein